MKRCGIDWRTLAKAAPRFLHHRPDPDPTTAPVASAADSNAMEALKRQNERLSRQVQELTEKLATKHGRGSV